MGLNMVFWEADSQFVWYIYSKVELGAWSLPLSAQLLCADSQGDREETQSLLL